MKKLLFFFVLILFFLPAQAQKGEDCPAVDWVKTITSDTDLYLYANEYPTKDGGEVVIGFYYQGCQSIAGKSVPLINSNINVEWGNMFLMKTDSNGKAEWILPFEITDAFHQAPGYPSFGLSSSYFLDSEENAHLIVYYSQEKFELLGKSYGFATREGKDKNGNRYGYYFKISPNGQLLKDFRFSLGNNLAEDYQNRPFVLYANASDSSLILLFRNTTADSISILGMSKISSPVNARYIVKVNAQFQAQWVKTISYFAPTGLIDERNSNELYLLGSLITKDGSPSHHYSVTFDNQRYSTTNSMKGGGVFMVKMNIQTGNFSDFKYLIEGNNQIDNFILMGGKGARADAMFPQSRGGVAGTEPIDVDNDNNVYIAGIFWDSLYIHQKGFIKLNKYEVATFLLKYNLNTQSKEVFILGVNNSSRKTPRLVRYLPKSDQILITGEFDENFSFNQDTLKGGNKSHDLYILSLDPNSKTVSDISEYAKQLKNNWLIYTTPGFDATLRKEYISDLYVDKQENIYVTGLFSGSTNWDWRNMNVVLDYNEKHAGNFHAKFTSLTSHIQHDATRMRAAQENAQYQWYDCENGMQAVSGATDRYFTPSNVNGKYAVKVSNTWCSVMSDCQKLSVPLVKDLHSVQIYPNPVSHTLYLSHLPIGVDVAVFDVMGRKIFSSSVQQSNFKINTESWAQGVYLVQLNYQGERWMEKVVK